MTREEILAMPAGRELDALVAEKVFGKNIQWTFGDEWTDSYPVDVDDVIVDHYSIDISASWELISNITDKSERERCGPCVHVEHDGDWHARIGRVHAMANTAPLAICRAALLTTMEETP